MRKKSHAKFADYAKKCRKGGRESTILRTLDIAFANFASFA